MINNLIFDYIKTYKHTPAITPSSFAEPWLIALRTAPAHALKYLYDKAKNLKLTSSWKQLDSKSHEKAFTIAKVTKIEMLQLVFDEMTKAINEGTSYEQWAKIMTKRGLIDRLQEAGWTGKSPSRIKLIYETNLKIAANQGKYKQMILSKKYLPNVRYSQVQRETKRPDHAKLHGLVFSLDDPIINTIAPPSAFHCNCRLVPTKSKISHNADTSFIKNSKDFYIKVLNDFVPQKTKYSKQLQGLL